MEGTASGSLDAWFGRPSSTVVAPMGDGSCGFTTGELETVCRSRGPITFVVFSNSNYGWIKASQKADEGALLQCRNRPLGPCRSRGGLWHEIVVVENPADLHSSLNIAISHDGPTLVDVIPVRRWMD